MKHFLVALLMILAPHSTMLGLSTIIGLPIGASAPSFTLKSPEGKLVRLADFKGKVILLDFWGVNCPPCRVEMPHLQRLQAKYQHQGLIVLGIAGMESTIKGVAQVTKTLGITYQIAMDPGDKLGKLYQITAHPTTILIGREGKILHIEEGYAKGDEQVIEAAIQKAVSK